MKWLNLPTIQTCGGMVFQGRGIANTSALRQECAQITSEIARGPLWLGWSRLVEWWEMETEKIRAKAKQWLTAIIGTENLILSMMGNHWKLLSRRVTLSPLPLRSIILAAVWIEWEMRCSKQWGKLGDYESCPCQTWWWLQWVDGGSDGRGGERSENKNICSR